MKKYNISIDEWNKMTVEQQEQYINNINIKVGYSSDISETITRGFGHLDKYGFWEYQCKSNMMDGNRKQK